MPFQFQKHERLKSLKAIRQIFSEGKQVKAFPIRAAFIPIENDLNLHQVAFSVPKKRFKRAVDRNRIKRQMREAYRLNRDQVLTELKQPVGIVFIYLSNQHAALSVIEAAMVKCMRQIAQ